MGRLERGSAHEPSQLGRELHGERLRRSQVVEILGVMRDRGLSFTPLNRPLQSSRGELEVSGIPGTSIWAKHENKRWSHSPPRCFASLSMTNAGGSPTKISRTPRRLSRVLAIRPGPSYHAPSGDGRSGCRSRNRTSARSDRIACATEAICHVPTRSPKTIVFLSLPHVPGSRPCLHVVWSFCVAVEGGGPDKSAEPVCQSAATV
jgi:hypothetical protein